MGKINKADCYYSYIGVVIVQLIFTGQCLLSKASVSEGIKPSVFVTYQQAFATLALAPFAFFLERKTSALTVKLLCKILFISMFGGTLCYNFYFSAMNYASATFTMAMDNTIPASVFIMAVLLRLESLALNKWYGRAKVIGCAVCLSGAMVFTFVTGSPLYHHAIGKETTSLSIRSHAKENWVKGFFLMLGSTLTWSFWLIMQGPIQKEYSAQVRLTTLQCCFSTLTSALWAAATQRNVSSWKLGWDINLVSVLYCGILVGGLTYWLQVWIIEKKGPVFVSMFTPLSLVLTAAFSALIFKDILHWGSVVGAVILVAGLYSFLWGEQKEAEARKHEEESKQSEANKIVLECITTSTPATTEPEKRETGKH